MTRNFATLLTTSLFFGLAVGIYEFALPYFLDSRGIPIPRMGMLYAVAALVIFFGRVYAGHLSDRFGRKSVYAAAVAVTGLVNLLTPVAVGLWLQTALKSLFDSGAMVFDSMYQLCLHDEGRRGYLSRMGRTRGVQALSAAVGTLFAGLLIAELLYVPTFWTASVACACGLVVFLIGYRPRADAGSDAECSPGERDRPRPGVSLRLCGPLAVLAVSSLIFTVGLSASHCFVMQLYWAERFGASASTTGVILMLHRFTIALPLLLLTWRAQKWLRRVFVVFLTVEGLVLVASGFIPHLWVAAAVWLLHDLFGAGVWMPAQSALIQRYSREGRRGADMSTVFAIGSLGWVGGPLIAGAVFDAWPGGPFVISGALMVVSAAVLLLLPPDSDLDATAQHLDGADRAAQSVHPPRDGSAAG